MYTKIQSIKSDKDPWRRMNLEYEENGICSNYPHQLSLWIVCKLINTMQAQERLSIPGN
jgi:hypothetical protein